MKNKKIALIIVALLILITSILIIVRLNNNKAINNIKPTPSVVSEKPFPTLDSSFKVDLVGMNNNKKIKLTMFGIPKSTESIEYSLSYQTKQQGLQGIIGTIELKKNESDFVLERDLGTCSSGTCIYHTVEGNIMVELKLSGKYGESLFSKDYSL
ncbi:hypothetical protein AUK04_04910 [Candidatus Roizmanbacteria bacterium CG2_30_33_16]|uniref:Uncharacterized protein n=5 Tax=Candidatus Roizmaniibacteriota TaxID=1752723 RepID=A0A2M7E3T3_9BACT|nr:hypothetical protein [Candidatus Roizmanbacteria bacterium]OIP82335.1 MAG: hypothetical protein AUK04_04910 [Candidatus Roizmanbacteria bacterium CG2_30_33_16]PIP63983.1 MAG: hypothetical protein COW96_05060 [Candidatus Roizmanbacteria bacterium CG22_combo_CG10-13_8_21_14_all_33_16]PIV62381.1 MAG: hypothetical protein COS12_02650 [Candidatus Roizmanbacteria bacterium CG01_land_8_20_14_3_00_33_9]PIX72353.1 MAG: hypothetical protein COZ39_03130 [Candidatus Roizmanbacteria bacterium CG_4_10_14_